MKKIGIKIVLIVLIATMLIPSVVLASGCDPIYEDKGSFDFDVGELIDSLFKDPVEAYNGPQNASSIEDIGKISSIDGKKYKKFYTVSNVKTKTSKNFKFKFTGTSGFYDFKAIKSSGVNKATISFKFYDKKSQKEKNRTYHVGNLIRLKKNDTYYVNITVTNKKNKDKKSAVCAELYGRMHYESQTIKDTDTTPYTYCPNPNKSKQETIRLFNSYIWSCDEAPQIPIVPRNTATVKYSIFLNREDARVLNYLLTYPKATLKDAVNAYVPKTGAGLKAMESAVSSWITDMMGVVGEKITEEVAEDLVEKSLKRVCSTSLMKAFFSLFDLSISRKGTKFVELMNQAAYRVAIGNDVYCYLSGIEIQIIERWSFSMIGGSGCYMPKMEIRIRSWNDESSPTKSYGKSCTVKAPQYHIGAFKRVDDQVLKAMQTQGNFYDVHLNVAGVTVYKF